MANPEGVGTEGTSAFKAAQKQVETATDLSELGGEELEKATEQVVARSKDATENDPNNPNYKRITDVDVAHEMAEADRDLLDAKGKAISDAQNEPSGFFFRNRGKFNRYWDAMRQYQDASSDVKSGPATTENIVRGTIKAELTNQGHVLPEEKKDDMIKEVTERLKKL